MAGPHNFIRIQPSGNLWAIRFDYDNNLVEAMREIGADWDAIRRVWVVADAARADVLSYANATSSTSSHFLSNVRVAKLKLLGVPELDMGRPLAPAGEALKPYQWEGVSFAAERPAILLADQPGLGKTNQAIGVMNAMRSWNKVLIVCPANMKMDWFLRMRGDPKYGQAGWLIDTTKTIGIAKGSYFPPTNIVIINHDITFRHKDKLREVTWDLIVIDECHFCKSTKAQRTIAICGGKRGRGNPPIRPLHGKRKMALSGTPLVNKPEEIWPICNWLDPKRWASENWFRERYSVYEEKCIGRKGKRIDPETGKPELKYVKSYAGAKNLEELNARLKGTIMLRRTKAEVLKDLPPKLRQVIEIDVPEASTAIGSERRALSGLSAEAAKFRAAIMLARVSGNEDDYREAVAALEDFYKGKGEQVALLRKQVALEKLPYVIDHVRNLLLDPDVKVVVFAHHREIVERIEGALKDFGAVKLYGGMDDVEKEGNKQRFQHDPTCRVFVASILAAGVGITLTASSNAVFAELDWVPANVTQAEDRLHRIGQRDSVLVQHIVAYGSLDAHIAKQLVRKQEVLDTVLDSGVAAQEPVDWLADHRGIPMDAELDNPVNQTPNAIAASQYGLKKLVDNPNEYHVTDSDLIVAQRLLEHQILVGRPAALARWLAKKYLEIQSPTA